ncbi:hypothetical protein RVR_8568 [Actinacidiphila reveromycinica]|uniref:Polyketide cyclase n=1 Tax=Actinacidiphila reveromycinica TaxID=659352 RepID=A0A7U3VS10_9ACTN|nr:SRPBCC family protein [Streptomyces sp. SN-593]BBB01255.1 hypothetical protein RVR_8568 [Streptomyces sp. SN-593]
MTDESPYEPVTVSRVVPAPPAAVFRVLTDPTRHTDLDGSGMLRGAVTETPVSRVGDVFTMRMYFAEHGHYEMDNHVVEFEQDRRVAWEPAAGRGHPGHRAPGSRWGHRWTWTLVPAGPDATLVTESYDCSRAPSAERAGMREGRVWTRSMERTLERLADAVDTAPLLPVDPEDPETLGT